jgi:hypothetical protein
LWACNSRRLDTVHKWLQKCSIAFMGIGDSVT